MAVKQKVVECVSQQSEVDRVKNILRFLQEIPEQKGLQDRMCAQIVAALGTLQIPTDVNKYMAFIKDIENVKELLTKECSNNTLVYATLEAFYKEISDPLKQPSPAMSIVLQLISTEFIPQTVKFLLQSNYSEQGLETALLTLCTWLTKWTCTENLGPLVLAFIQGLENDSHYDILLEVTEETIAPLFRLIVLVELRKYIVPVVFHMLVHVQHRPQVFHKIIPDVGLVISHLERDKSPSSDVYIQKLVDLCTALMEHYPTYDILYEPLRKELMLYCPSADYKEILSCKNWCDGSAAVTAPRYNPGKVGLNNLGNTCYMNSVLQALFMTKMFRNQVLLSRKEEVIIFSKLQLLFALLQHSQKSSLSPNDILNLARPPGFIQGHQHDSSEFLGYLLDVLHEQEKGHTHASEIEIAATSAAATASNAANTIVQQAFGGRTITVFQCGDCGTKSERIDNFRELQLSFPSNKDNQSVQDLVDYYIQPEKLSGDNQYQCDVCRRLTDGERATKVIETPQQLILTLKHFRYDPASQQRTKLLTHFNLNDIIVLEGIHYILNAVVVHSGCSVDSGHYYTFAKDNNDWYKFNDCFVTKSSAEELGGLKPPATPYILFYSKQNCLETSDIDKTLLPARLQSALARDNSEYEMEKRRRPIKPYNTRQNRNDDPPPPSCGGGGFSDSSSNMYVC